MLTNRWLMARCSTIAVALVLPAAVGCSSGTPRTEAASGVRIWVGRASEDSMTALMQGTVAYDRADDCFRLVTQAETYPVVWPHGSKGTADPPGVVLADGTVVHDGEQISFGGGYVKVADDYDIPASCLSPSGDVAVIQTT